MRKKRELPGTGGRNGQCALEGESGCRAAPDGVLYEEDRQEFTQENEILGLTFSEG